MSTLRIMLLALGVAVILPLYTYVELFAYVARYRHFDKTVNGMLVLLDKAHRRGELTTLLLWGVLTWFFSIVVLHFLIVHVF